LILILAIRLSENQELNDRKFLSFIPLLDEMQSPSPRQARDGWRVERGG
jgi:hypothetical protein